VLGLLRRQPSGVGPKLDLPGAALVSAGMFCIVYGFSKAALHGWRSVSCWAFLAVGGGALTAFGWWTAHPLLPPRIVADQPGRGAYLAILIAGSACSARSCSSATTCSRCLGSPRCTPGWRSCR